MSYGGSKGPKPKVLQPKPCRVVQSRRKGLGVGKNTQGPLGARGAYFRQVPRDKPGPCGLYKASITYSLEERCFHLGFQLSWWWVSAGRKVDGWVPTRHGLLPCSYIQEGCTLAHLTLSANCLSDKAVRELSR